MTIKYTIDELIVYRAAQEIRDGEMVVIGQGIGMAAGVLARSTHAPNSVILSEAGIVGIDPFKVPLHIADMSAFRGYTYGCDMMDAFTCIANQGYVDVAFLGVGQMDKYGNVNSVYIGNPDNFEMRLSGAGGAPEFAAYSMRTVFTMSGGQFVKKLDYLTSPGYLEGGNSRYKAGMPAGSGPAAVITQDGVFKFDQITKEIFLSSVHPGKDVEKIKSKIPWDLKVAVNLEVTKLPSEKDLEFIRTFAPFITMGRKLQIECNINRIFKMLTKASEQKEN
ncbi:MAG: CoA-transferase [Dehalococcoidia bacterium]